MRTYSLFFATAIAILSVCTSSALAQSNSKEIMARPAAELVELLKNPDASVFDKAKACQQLAVVGDKTAVPALAALLPDEKLNVYARFGLEAIPDPSVDAALRDAATKLQGMQLVGVIGSIGERKDAQAVDLLKSLLSNSDAAVASAAAGALGQIGTPEAAAALSAALEKQSPAKRWIADGCIICADHLAAAGQKDLALGMLKKVSDAELPKYVRMSAAGGLLRIMQGEGKSLLMLLIADPDEDYFKVGLSFARQIPGAQVAAGLTEALAGLPPERQALVLRALADRNEPVPVPAVLAAAKSDSSDVRQAAIYVLAKYGDASTAAILLDAAMSDAEVAQAAQEGLKKLSGEEVDAAILARLAGADAKSKTILFDLLASRRITSAKPALIGALGDGDASVRIAALTALGRVAGLEDIELLAGKALADGDSPETAAAKTAFQTALLRMSDRDACAAKLAGMMGQASAEKKVYVLDVLGKMGGEKSLAIVFEYAKSSDPALKDAATRVLGEWLNADAAPMLLDIVKTDADPKYQLRALRGYIRIARQLQLPAETKLAMFQTAMQSAKRDEEKRLALVILTRIPSPSTLEIAVSHLGEAALKGDAADAAVKIGAKIYAQDPRSVAAAMQKVVDAKIGGDVESRATQLLGQAQAALK